VRARHGVAAQNEVRVVSVSTKNLRALGQLDRTSALEGEGGYTTASAAAHKHAAALGRGRGRSRRLGAASVDKHGTPGGSLRWRALLGALHLLSAAEEAAKQLLGAAFHGGGGGCLDRALRLGGGLASHEDAAALGGLRHWGLAPLKHAAALGGLRLGGLAPHEHASALGGLRLGGIAPHEDAADFGYRGAGTRGRGGARLLHLEGDIRKRHRVPVLEVCARHFLTVNKGSVGAA